MKPKVLIAIPTMHTLPYLTVMSLLKLVRHYGKRAEVEFINASAVWESRNDFSLIARDKANRYDYLLFIDSDMTFPEDALDKLIAHKKDIATGVYFTKELRNQPVCYKKVTPFNKLRPSIPASREPITKDMMAKEFEVEGCGTGFLLINTDVLDKVTECCGKPFDPEWNLSEDLAFCVRARMCGYKIFADGTIPLGHIGSVEFDYRRWQEEKKDENRTD